jgi:hypothetical protein
MAAEKSLKSSPFNFQELVARKEFVGALIGLIGAFFLFPFFFEVHLYPLGALPADPSLMVNLNKMYPFLSLDPSWTAALNKFNIDHLIWGKDIAFTYGPLAFLSTRIGWGASWYAIVLFDLFMAFNFFFIFYTGYVKSKNLIATIVLMAATCILLPATFASGNALVLLAFIVFWIRQSLDENKMLYYVMQVIIILLAFFTKFNTSLICFVFFFAGLLFRAIFLKEDKRKIFIYLIIPIVLVFIFSILLNVSIVGYLLGGLNTISGFNEIMYLELPMAKEYKYTWGIICITLFLLLFRIYQSKSKKVELFRNLLVLFLYTASLYILYKQAFIRNDIEHILDFNKFGLLFILCISDFHFTQPFKFSNILIGLIIVLSFFFSRKRDDKLLNLNERIFKGRYVKGLKNFSDTSGYHLYPNNDPIPQKILDKIGKQSVDIYAWNILLLLQNKLNYKPRPVCQSYVAFTPYLENLNFDFYNSENAPEFLLYDMDAIDGRSGFFDEPKFHLAMLKNYEFIDFFNYAQRPVLLLKKKPGQLPKISLQKINEYQVNLNDIIQPKENVYYEVHVHNSLKGKIAGVMGHSPDIALVVLMKNGTQQAYRTCKKMLVTGFFSTYHFASTADVYSYMSKEGMKPENEVIGYQLKVKTPTHFNTSATVTEYKIN